MTLITANSRSHWKTQVLGDCPGQNSPVYDALLYEFYMSMPDLFGHLLTRIYTLWHQNGSFHKDVSRNVVTLIKMDPGNGNEIRNLRPIFLLNTYLKIRAKMRVKRLARVMRGLIPSGKQRIVLSRAGTYTSISTLYSIP